MSAGLKLSRNTKLLSLASFLTDISTEMIVPILPFFLTQILAAPVLIVGLIEGLREATANLVGIGSGIYTDSVGRRKRTVIAGYGVSTIVKGLLVLASSWMQVAGITFLERIGKGLRGPPRDALIHLSEPTENLGKAFGFRKMLDNAGAILGPMIVSVLFILYLTPGMEETYRMIFSIALVPAILAVVLLFFVQEKRTPPQSARAIVLCILELPNYRRFLLGMGVFALGSFAIPLFLVRTGEFIPLLLIPIAYLTYNVFFTIFAMPAGYITDRFGGKRALLLAQLLFLLALAGFAFFANMQSVFLFMLLLGIFMAFYETAPRVFLAKAVEEKTYASALGIYNGTIGLIALPANLIAGLLWDKTFFGVPAALLFSMGTTIVGIGLLQKMVKE